MNKKQTCLFFDGNIISFGKKNMKKIITLYLLLFYSILISAQNDLCANAAVLTPGLICVSTLGTFNGSSLDGASSSCALNASQDVWYKFTATDPTMYVEVSNAVNIGLDVAMEIYSGSCSGTLVTCQNFGTASQGYEGYFNTNFVVGQTYFIRVLNASANASSQNFSICVKKYPTPVNDLCANAASLTPGLSCTSTAGSFAGTYLDGTTSSCAQNASQDVWYKFTATDPTMYVEVSNAVNIGLDVAMEIYSGSCGGTLVTCQNYGTATQGYENYFNNNFMVGQTYYIRVLNVSANVSTQDFSICVQKNPTPSNDLCANAAALAPSPTCTATSGSFSGTMLDGNPSACAPNTQQDIWYKFIATDAAMYVEVNNPINIGLDVAMEIYAAGCSGTLITCRNNATASQGYEAYSNTDFIVGQTYYVRVMNVSAFLSTQNFSICVQGPTLRNISFEAEKFNIVPNPVKDTIVIPELDTTGSYTYHIMNVQGEILRSGTLTNDGIESANLAGGIYFLRLSGTTRSFVKKFIKE